MMSSNSGNRILSAALVLMSGWAGAQTPSDQKVYESFGEDLKIFHQYMERDESGYVRLNVPETLLDSADARSLKLVQELVDFTNETIQHSHTAGFRNLSQAEFRTLASRSVGPELQSYFKFLASPRNAPNPFAATGLRGVESAEDVCGSFANPTAPASWQTLTSEQFGSDWTSYLTRRGFHETPDTFYGGGWTKPKTYRPDLCQWDSFRDHAYYRETYKALQLQIYDGMTPNGEPNPEINNYTWPYATWPAYVAWWHAKY